MASDDVDYTLPESPPPSLRRVNASPPPVPRSNETTNKSSSSAPVVESNDLLAAAGLPETPYTSTPAPTTSMYIRSAATTKSTASSTSSKLSGNTTVRPLVASINQHGQKASYPSKMNDEESSVELPSFDQEPSLIQTVDHENSDDVVVINSESGSDSDRALAASNSGRTTSATRRHLSSSGPIISPAERMSDERDLTSSSSSSAPDELEGYFTSERLDSPAAPIHPNPHDYEIPIASSSDDDDEPPILPSTKYPESARARRLSEANIATRRKPSFKPSTTSIVLPDDSPDSLPPMPTEIVDSPEVGRRGSMSPLTSRDTFPSLSNLSTPQARHSSIEDPKTPLASNAFSRIYATPDVHSTAQQMLPASSSPAAVRRAQHVLTTLRSTAKPAFRKKGTPHPTTFRGRQLVDTPRSAHTDAEEREEEDSFDLTSAGDELTSSSSNDLTTLNKGNTSLPSGAVSGIAGKSERFDHVKLNTYLHQFNGTLTKENHQLTDLLEGTKRENFELKVELEKVKEMSRLGSSYGGGVSLNGNYNERLKEMEIELKKLRGEVDEARHELQEEKERRVESETEVARLEGALEEAQTEMTRQEEMFAEKQTELHDELAKIMDEQDKLSDSTRSQLEAAKDEIERLQAELETNRFELAQVKTTDSPDIEPEDINNELVSGLRDDVRKLEDEVAELEQTIEKKDAELDDLEKKHEALIEDEKEARRVISEQAENIAQIEEALDESAQQLVQNEDELESLKSQLATEKNVNSTLSTQISTLKLPKAKSPLANEVYNSNKDSIIASLEEELAVLHKENEALKRPTHDHDETIEVQAVQIKTLEKHKIDLEERVASLRAQVSMSLGGGLGSPSTSRRVSGTPDKSNLFRSILGLQTPKTPGQMLHDFSAWTPGSAGDESVAPLYSRMQELVQIIEDLREQLSETNADVDRKLDQLEAAGNGTISLARQLSQAKRRISKLESDLEKLLGQEGSLYRVKNRLTKLTCPECVTTFDANKIVQLRIDQSGVSFLDTSPPHQPESLKLELADLKTKIIELETENAVLSQSSSRSRDLTIEKTSLSKQLASVQTEFAKARSEIVELELELQSERTQLRSVKIELESTASELQSLKSASSNPAELARSASSISSIEFQLTQRLTEIAKLKSLLQEKEISSRLLKDERADILRGVAGLQSDLIKVKQDAISLGLDLENVRRERDSLGLGDANQEGDRLKEARQRIVELERRIKNFDHSSDSTLLADLKARHSKESKGLLVMISYLKKRCTREVSFRNDLSYQKSYLHSIVEEKQATINAIMEEIGLPSSLHDKHTHLHQKKSFKSIVLTIIALNRMQRSSQEWKSISRSKNRLRSEAYPTARGKPFQPITA